MLRGIILLTGFLLLIGSWYYHPLSYSVQYSMFIGGILFLGIPHGAADLLVANEQAVVSQQSFSIARFFVNYILRLLLFGLLIYFLPVTGLILFIVMAAYHFGETDLYFFDTKSIAGKLLVSSYGLIILSVILLGNIAELKRLLQASGFNNYFSEVIYWIQINHTRLLLICFLFFVACNLFYFLGVKRKFVQGYYLLQLVLLVLLLYYMPLILGFTFYFIVWHSMLSLQKIFAFLLAGKKYAYSQILKQIFLYSLLAFAGILLIGIPGSMFFNYESFTIYIFIGLAVLTAPHMQIMHEMYLAIRRKDIS